MKLIQPISLAAAAALSVSCFGKREESVFAEPAPAATAPKPAPSSNLRPNRPPPPPQPQDGSMIVTPGGTTLSSVPKVDEKDKNEALAAAEREIIRRKQSASEADDLVSKALKNVDQDDLDKAFKELKKAVDKYPKTGE